MLTPTRAPETPARKTVTDAVRDLVAQGVRHVTVPLGDTFFTFDEAHALSREIAGEKRAGARE